MMAVLHYANQRPGTSDQEPSVHNRKRVILSPRSLRAKDLKASAEQSSDSRKTFALTKTRYLIPGH
jgi:hypothetical protein